MVFRRLPHQFRAKATAEGPSGTRALQGNPNPRSEFHLKCPVLPYAGWGSAVLFRRRYGRMLAISAFPSRWAKNKSHRS